MPAEQVQLQLPRPRNKKTNNIRSYLLFIFYKDPFLPTTEYFFPRLLCSYCSDFQNVLYLTEFSIPLRRAELTEFIMQFLLKSKMQ